MKAIILAAGRGSRMGGLTAERPKCMVEFGGKPLLQWQTDACREAGVSDIAIVTGYRKESFSGRGYRLFENPRWEATYMVRSLLCAGDWLASEPCIVSYSDIFYEAAAVRQLIKSPASFSVLYDVNWLKLWQARFADVLADAETFRIDANQRITEIGQRARDIAEIQGQYMGLLGFTPEGFAQVIRFLASFSSQEVDRLSMTGLL